MTEPRFFFGRGEDDIAVQADFYQFDYLAGKDGEYFLGLMMAVGGEKFAVAWTPDEAVRIAKWFLTEVQRGILTGEAGPVVDRTRELLNDTVELVKIRDAVSAAETIRKRVAAEVRADHRANILKLARAASSEDPEFKEQTLLELAGWVSEVQSSR